MKRPAKLTKADQELIDAATASIKPRYRDDWQEVGAALRTRRAKFSPASISTLIWAAWRSAPRRWRSAAPSSIPATAASTPSSRCAIRRPDDKDQPIAVVSPCGACRELIFDYDPKARVIVPKE